MHNPQDEDHPTAPGSGGFLAINRRGLLMLGLSAGAIALSTSLIAPHLSPNDSPDAPPGFAFVVCDGQFVTVQGAYLLVELSSW